MRALLATPLILALGLSFPAPALAESPPAGDRAKAAAEKKTPPVTVDAIVVEPESPPPDTLCKLRVKITNHTDRDLSGFGFQVKVNGTELGVYGNQRYMEALEPGATRELELYNFWSSETSRPPRKDGSLTVEVAVVEARYLERTTEEDVPVWTLLEEVPGLPASLTATPTKK